MNLGSSEGPEREGRENRARSRSEASRTESSKNYKVCQRRVAGEGQGMGTDEDTASKEAAVPHWDEGNGGVARAKGRSRKGGVITYICCAPMIANTVVLDYAKSEGTLGAGICPGH